MTVKPLAADKLRLKTDPARLPFETTANLPESDGPVGQQRAMRFAGPNGFELGLAEPRNGHDVVVVDEEEDVLVPDVAAKVAAKPAAAGEESDDDDEEEPDDEDVEASLDTILKERLVVEEVEDDEEAPEPEDRSGDGVERVLPKQPGEFVCRSCFLVKHPNQLADRKHMLCRDCV